MRAENWEKNGRKMNEDKKQETRNEKMRRQWLIHDVRYPGTGPDCASNLKSTFLQLSLSRTSLPDAGLKDALAHPSLEAPTTQVS